jgi:hypothetical protein
MVEDQFEYVDECPQVRRRRSLYNDNDKTTLEQEQSQDIPEEIMAQLEDFLGDGTARITVSADLGSSVSYHSAKAFVSVSVPCNNDIDSISSVHDILKTFVQELAEEDHGDMGLRRDALIDPGAADRPTPDQRQAQAQIRQPPKRGGDPGVQSLKRGGKTITPKGVKKPSFRR